MVLQGGELRGIVLICSWAPNNSWYLHSTRYNDVVSPTGIAEIRKKPKMKLQLPTIQMLDAYWRSRGRADRHTHSQYLEYPSSVVCIREGRDYYRPEYASNHKEATYNARDKG